MNAGRAEPITLAIATAALVAAALLVAPSLQLAHAHGETVESFPAPGSTLDAAPTAVTVTLSAPLALGSEIQVLDAGFQRVDDGVTRIDVPEPRRMSVGLSKVAAGDYTVQWTALDSQDGHRTQGSFVFSVAADAAAGDVDAVENRTIPTVEGTDVVTGSAPGSADPTGATDPTDDIDPTDATEAPDPSDESVPDASPPGFRGSWTLMALGLVLGAAIGLAIRRRVESRSRANIGAAAGLLLLALAASACAGETVPTPGAVVENGDDANSPTAAALADMPTAAADSVPTQVILASSDLAVGRQRFAFGLLDDSGGLVQSAEVEVTFFKLTGADAVAMQTLPATFYPSALAPAGVYVLYTSFENAGAWGAEIRARLPGGEAAPPQRVRFTVAQISASPGVGEPPPALANRTLATEPDLAKLTSDPHPDPDLYQMTVDAARASGKPTVVLFATPGFCQSKVCGPVVDEIKQLKPKWAAKVNFIHIEVYKTFDPLVFDDAMASWGLKTEPWVFVLDGEGIVAERMEGSVTAAELEPVLQTVAGG